MLASPFALFRDDLAGREVLFELDARGNVLKSRQIVGSDGNDFPFDYGETSNDILSTYTYTPPPTGPGQVPGGLVDSMTDPHGRLTSYDPQGVVLNDRTYSGTRNYTFTRTDGQSSYTVEGTLALQNVADGTGVSVVGTGLQQTDQCCRPTSGTLMLTTSTGTAQTWTFGPTCGEATRDGVALELPDCP